MKIGTHDKSISDLFRLGIDLMNEPIFSSFVDEKISVNSEDESATISLAVPGYDKKDLKLTIQKNKLFIYLKSELFKTYFLTKSVDKESIDATLKNGLLKITFDRQEAPDEEEININ
jgi:HSP20 family molecular chaperone IbpA